MRLDTTAPRASAHAHAATHASYFPRFDWLRAACALVVLLYHGRVVTWPHAGHFAVQVFFALSGWLIGGILIRMEPAALPRFFFNRALRIWVPYYLALAILLSLSVLRDPITPKWLEIVAYKLSFVYNLFGTQQLTQFRAQMPQQGTMSHVWSVNVEEQFYLLAPLLLVLARRWGRSPLLWLVLGAGGLFTDAGPIALGVLAAILVQRFGPVHEGARFRLATLLVLVACGAAMMRDVGYTALSGIAGLCIVLLLAVPGRRTLAGELAGGMSYPLYLNHWIGIFAANALARRLPLGWAGQAAVQVAVAVPIAIGLYWSLDRRLFAARQAWFTPRRGATMTAVAYAIMAAGLAFGLAMLARAS